MNILSLQSHVAYGHVGNSAAVLPLQRLGHEVWAIHTVMFSNHTGYGSYRGPLVAAEDVAEVVAGLAERGLMAACDAVLSGYLGEAEVGEAILDAASRVRGANGRAIYACDPVMGDTRRGIVVRAGIPEFMRERAVPAADLITPNQFELEVLTGIAVSTLDDALRAAAEARKLGPSLVLVTSLTRRGAPSDSVEMLAATDAGAWVVATPRLPLDPAPAGAGDVVAAVFLAHFLETASAAAALGRAAAAIFAVLEVTHEAGARELQLVKAQDVIVAPRRTFAVDRIA